MSVRPKEIVEILKKAGFRHWKNGSRHALWKKGDEIVPVSYGTKASWYLGPKMRNLMRRHGVANG